MIHAYIINMDSAVARWQHVRQAFEQTGISFERLPAVNGRAIEGPIPQFAPRRYRWCHGKRPNLATVGCYLSHLKAMQRLVDSHHEFGIICEDDITPTRQLKAILLDAIQHAEAWDILRLSGFHRGCPVSYARLRGGHTLAVNLTRLCGSGAYMIHRRTAEHLLQRIVPMYLPIDHVLDREWVYGLRSSSIVPLPVDQEAHTFSSQIKPEEYEKLPAWQRYWTVFPFRLYNETSRLLMRGQSWLRLATRYAFSNEPARELRDSRSGSISTLPVETS